MTKNPASLLVIFLLLFTELNAQYIPGTYEGEAYGRKDEHHSGSIRVSVTLSENKIENIVVSVFDQNSEHKKFGKYINEAKKKIPEQIIENQSVQVDAVSMATHTSSALELAVAKALFKGLTKKFNPGIYKSSTVGWSNKNYSGEIEVEVSLSESSIYSIAVTKFDQDTLHKKYGSPALQAKSVVPKEVIEEEKLDVDGVSGATMSSNAILLAVYEAVRQAVATKN